MTAQICLSVDEHLLLEIDSLITLIGSPWHKPTRADVARVGLSLGLSALKAQACATVSLLSASVSLPPSEDVTRTYAAFPANAPSREPVESAPSAEITAETQDDVDPIELRKRLIQAIADGVKVSDLAAQLNVGVSYIYAFKGGKSMNHARRIALHKALSKHVPPTKAKTKSEDSIAPPTQPHAELRARLKRALSKGATIAELAKKAHVGAANFYRFKDGHGIGPGKLAALDKALAALERTSAPLRNRPNVVVTPPAQPPADIATRVIGAFSETDPTLTFAQIQDRVRVPAIALSPVVAKLVSDKRLDVTGINGSVAYHLEPEMKKTAPLSQT